MRKSKGFLLIIDLFILMVLVAVDQITKNYAVLYLRNQPAYSVIDGVLEFNYLENRGMAFGLLQDQTILFLFFGVIFLLVITYVLFKSPVGKKYTIMHFLLTVITAGAIGNMIDRLHYGFVVDYIYVVLINFPIFNIADIYVTVGTFVLILLFLFYYKEDDLSFLNFKQNKYRELK